LVGKAAMDDAGTSGSRTMVWRLLFPLRFAASFVSKSLGEWYCGGEDGRDWSRAMSGGVECEFESDVIS
jgi:hypothetical protein